VSSLAELVVQVPASSANLGPGFDALGLALDLHASIGTGEPPAAAHRVDQHHPADVAFRRLGGVGQLWVRCPIPMGRGLGFSGAVRVGGAALAVAQAGGWSDGRLLPEAAADVLHVTTELEGHADNVAASLHGGVVVVAAGRVVEVPLALEPVVVVWIPDVTTSTDRSRSTLPTTVPLADAVFNIGRTALLVAALAAGDAAALRDATSDRLHQSPRLAAVPGSAAALEAGLSGGAWCGWLSGSGPSVAFLCDPERVAAVTGAFAAGGHVKVLGIDRRGTVVSAG
jgi:homoserine kinase